MLFVSVHLDDETLGYGRIILKYWDILKFINNKGNIGIP